MNNITKKTQTILFASLIAAMILPFSGMMMAEASPVEKNTKSKKTIQDYEFVKSKINEQIQNEEKIRDDKITPDHEKSRAENEVKRLKLTDKLADLKIKILSDPDNSEKYAEKASKIFEQLDALYGPGIPSLPPSVNAQIKQVFDTDTDFQGSDRTRYHCLTSSNWDANVYGDVDTHWPFGSDWNAYWFYPTQATDNGTPPCDTYDNDGNWIKITGNFPLSCEHNTADDDFSDSFYCPLISYGTTVTINGNAKYEGSWWHPSHSFDVVYLE